MTVKAQSASSSLDDVLSDLADRQLILTGKFNDEISRLAEIKAGAEEKLGMLKTVAEANHFRDTWEGILAKGKAEAAAMEADAAQTRAQAQGMLAQANKRMTDAETLAKRSAENIAEYERRNAKLTADSTAKESDLAERESALRAAQEKHAADVLALEGRHKALLDKARAWAEMPV